MKKIYIDSIESYNSLYGLSTKHPLVAAVDLKQCSFYANNFEMRSELYGLFLKNTSYCSVKYGRKTYDFQAGTIVSFAPGQTTVMNIAEDEISLDVIGIIFHPDLIYGTSLSNKIKDFNFFTYSEIESLHLSEREREKFVFYYEMIKEELENPIDGHTASVISTNIQLLLEHLQRFYDRQFITRHCANTSVLKEFENNLKNYFKYEMIKYTPNVAYFANKAALSIGYFSDLIKKETGKSPKDIIDLYLVSEAKKRLIESTRDISEIAYSLGFDYPAHFTRIFKRIVGMTPREYRLKSN